jgi:hypothetical protein
VFGVRRQTPQSGDEGSVGGNPADSASQGHAPASDKPDGAGAGDGGASGQRTSRGRQPGPKAIAIGTAAVLAIAAGVAYAITAGTGGNGSPKAAASPIRVVSVTPANQTTGVDGANPIIVTFNRPVSPSSPKPTVTPNVPGDWTAFGDSLEFMPTTPFSETTSVTVQIPGGATGVHSSSGGLLTAAVTSQFTTGAYSQAGLAVLLAEQGYLPLSFAPDHTSPAMADLWGADAAADTPQGEAYQPPPGTFSWASGYPASLVAQWAPNQANVILEGAVMAFKSEHNMTIDGSLTPQLWTALFQAQESGQQNANGYTYAVANKGSPETLTIWHNGQVVLTSLANTGISVAPTVDGTFPVYERFLNTIMSGTNPDGSHYSDPVQFVSYFNGGDAVHYFARGSYGFPQSLGCVELPYNAAQQAYPYLTYGSLVTVQG